MLKKIETTDSNLVKKSNHIVRAGYYMTLAEQQFMAMAILTAKKEGLTDKPFNTALEVPSIRIAVTDFARTFQLDYDNARRTLNTAANSLLGKRVFFKQDDKEGYDDVGIVWVNKRLIGTKDGIRGNVEVRFNPEVFVHFCSLEKLFTQYYIGYIAKLKSKYSIRLYEYAQSYVRMNNNRSPVITYEEFRFILGVDEGKYSRMYNFKSRVLDNAVSEINSETDLNIEYEQFFTGPNITHFQVVAKFKDSKKRVAEMEFSLDKLKKLKMSDMQRGFFAKKLSALPAFSAMARTGQSTTDFLSWIAQELCKPERIFEWKASLEAVGFDFKSLQAASGGTVEQQADEASQDKHVKTESFWTAENILEICKQIVADDALFLELSGGLSKEQFQEYLQDDLVEKGGRQAWWHVIKAFVPEHVNYDNL